jgi:phosphoesterase RecJ-like protein
VVPDKAIATGLYVALATDTGSFKFDLTTPEVHTLAGPPGRGRGPAGRGRPAGLRQPPVRGHPAAHRGAHPGRARAGGRRRAGPGRAYATLEDLARFAQEPPILESFMDVLRTAEEADVACLVEAGGARPVGGLPEQPGRDRRLGGGIALGGGGHKLAAGFTGYGEGR